MNKATMKGGEEIKSKPRRRESPDACDIDIDIDICGTGFDVIRVLKHFRAALIRTLRSSIME